MAARHFLDIHDFDAAALNGIITSARLRKDLRSGFSKGMPDKDKPLAGKSLALIFERPSTRTRVSFEMAMRQLGGEVIVLNAGDMQLGRGETIADTARVLSRYVDCIMLRAAKHETLEELAQHATVPVINGLTNRSHPCKIMADILTHEEHKGPLAKLKVAWVGDGNNVASSWIEAAGVLGASLSLACPRELNPDPQVLGWGQARNPNILLTADAEAAVSASDCVMTDTWVSMHDQDGARRHNLLKPYQVNRHLMAKAKRDAVFMHDLPAHRNEEVTDEVIDGPQSIVFDQAENRLHVQKAILLHCLGGS